eukprot:6203193-Pleurochrysis_carterae.AAC.2
MPGERHHLNHDMVYYTLLSTLVEINFAKSNCYFCSKSPTSTIATGLQRDVPFYSVLTSCNRGFPESLFQRAQTQLFWIVERLPA